MKFENIIKFYNKKNELLSVLNGISCCFEEGKFYAIMGQSGSGKTTFINIAGLMDLKFNGEYFLDGVNIKCTKEKKLAELRNTRIGFVFQNFFLDEKLTALENVMLPTIVRNGLNNKDRKALAMDQLQKVNLLNRCNHYPNELSGGECQRVAIARALVNNPQYIIADEPTGNLDEKNEKIIFQLLKKISLSGKTVIVVSHNISIMDYCDVCYELKEGKLYEK